MAFVEDPSVFLADFGRACTLAGADLQAIVDVETVADEATGVLTQRPVARVVAADASGAASGQAFVDDGTAYTVRQVLTEPPDGVMLALVLARD
jgi:hypothetical protein